MPPQPQFDYPSNDEEALRQSDLYFGQNNVRDAEDRALAMSFVGFIFHTIGYFISLGASICAVSVKTRVQVPGVVNIYKLAIGKVCIELISFITILVTTWVMVSRSRGWRAGWPTMLIFGTFGAASMALSALTFVGFAQNGYNGIVGTKVTNSSLYEHYDRRGRLHSGDGSAYYNNDNSRRAVIGTWVTSGIFEAIVGTFYLLATIFWICSKWFCRGT